MIKIITIIKKFKTKSRCKRQNESKTIQNFGSASLAASVAKSASTPKNRYTAAGDSADRPTAAYPAETGPAEASSTATDRSPADLTEESTSFDSSTTADLSNA